jgi:hypothetical protein
MSHGECDEPTEHHSNNCIPGMFPKIAEALGELCESQGDYLVGDLSLGPPNQ